MFVMDRSGSVRDGSEVGFSFGGVSSSSSSSLEESDGVRIPFGVASNSNAGEWGPEDDDVEFLRDAGGISSGNATSLMIFNAQRSACSSDKPTQVRSGLRTKTCEALGECDWERTAGGSSSDESEGSAAEALRSALVRDEPVLLLDRVMTVAELISGHKSTTEDESSCETGEMNGEMRGDICEVSCVGSDEYRSNPAVAINDTTF